MQSGRARSSRARACSPTSSASSRSTAAAAATTPSVEPKIIRLEQGRVDLVFEINEGDVTGIKRISFVGNERFSDGTLRGKIKTTESAWWRFLSSDDRFDPDRLNLDRELLRKFYLSEGYADFRVVSAVAELSPDRDGFFITFTINEGERYKFGKVEVTTRFQGLDTDTLKSYLTMSEGDWYDADEVEKTVTALTDAVGTLGYAFVDVRPNIRRNKDTNTVDVTFDIQEGPRVYVERINISGNTRTLDKVIRREFRLAEGDAFSTAKVRRSQQRLRNLGFFEKVDISAAPGSAPDKTNLEVQVVEQSTGEISFGAGYSTHGGHPRRHRDPRAQPARQGPGTAPRPVARHAEHADRSQLHRAVFPRSQHRRPASTSSGHRTTARTIASYSDTQPRLRVARRLGLHRAYPPDRALHAAPDGDLQRPALGLADRPVAGRLSSVVSEVSETIAWDTRDTRINTTKGWLLRNTVAVGRPRRNRALRPHDGRRRASSRSIIEDFVVSVGGSAGIVAAVQQTASCGSTTASSSAATICAASAVGGIGPRDANTTDSLGGQYYYTGDRRAELPASACPRKSACSARRSSMSARSGASADRYRRRQTSWTAS